MIRTLFTVCCAMLSTLLMLATMAGTSADDVVIRPQPKAGPLDNPLKGWCPYTNAGPIEQPYSMVFQYISWRELEPVENDFRFEDWEKTWDTEAASGKHIIFRVYIDYPSKPSGLPDWLRSVGVKETEYQNYGGGQSPDYNDPQMIAAMERLIAALGKRYNENPRIAFIQLGLLGYWGEWHTYPKSELYASPETEQRVIDAYRKAFPDKQLMVRYARDHAGQQDWLGFHDDMFPEDTDNGEDWSFLAGLRRTHRDNNWKRAIIGGEMVPGGARKWLGADFSVTRSMLERSHFSWIGPYCPALTEKQDETFRQRSEQLIREMGYEYQITEVVHPAEVQSGETATIVLRAKNTGVAPFYYPWVCEWALFDQAGKLVMNHQTNWDIRTWLPGSFGAETTVRLNLKPGTYRLGMGIRDPWQNRPAIQFANDLPVTNGWTMVSEVRVTN
ncbi:MAG: DUF4832 domain-containing protein [Planctomyces sp.]|nr:DUF4832 domain-containing protein [Planctomyces sp.]